MYPVHVLSSAYCFFTCLYVFSLFDKTFNQLFKYCFNINCRCRKAFHLDDYIAAVNNSGSLHIWDKFNGDMVSCMEKAGVLGMSSHRNNIVISRAHCIHCFTVQ